MNNFRILILILLISGPALGKQALFVHGVLNLSDLKIKSLSKDPLWMKLNRYRPSLLGGYKSSIQNKSFFLHKKGRTSPSKELEQTLKEFTQTKFFPKDSNKHALCRFPARLQWAKENIPGLAKELPQIVCSDYEKWVDEEKTESISLIFATGYLSNPASYYGHILLRFNEIHEIGDMGLLDISLNYGATINPKDNALVYILKGLFGGYSARFTHNEVYSHNHNYGENELRDLWAYELNLQRREVLLLLRNSWEVLNADFRYFFTKQNCAYRMLELLEEVIPEKLLNRKLLWTMPINAFHKLNSIEKKRNIIKSVKKINSSQSEMQKSYLDLTKVEKQFFKIFLKKGSFEDQGYRSFNIDSKHAVSDALLTYHNYVEFKTKYKKDFSEKKRLILLEQFKLSKEKPYVEKLKFEKILLEKSIHKSQHPSLIGFSGLRRSKANGFNLRFRPAYYDLLSPVVGRSPYTGLTMLEANLSKVEDEVFISEAVLLQIDNLNLTKTFLSHDGGLAWNVKLGLEQRNFLCVDCPTYYFTGGVGKAVNLGVGAVYFYLQGRAEVDPYSNFNFAGEGRLGFVSHHFYGLRFQSSVLFRENSDEKLFNTDFIFESELRYSISKNTEVSVQFKRNKKNQTLFGMYFFW